jgi:hypothetical protein
MRPPRAGRTEGPGDGQDRSSPAWPRGPVWALPACLALAALSLLLPSTPSYDPWAWLVWGREVAALELDTRFGPSWKPLPVLFTTPFSLLGEAAPALWLVVARAGALLGLVAAYRLGRRLGGPLAGLLAAAALALSGGYLRWAAIGFSEGLLVALVLLAIERHLAGCRWQALALGFGAALLRPESWPFLGLYALWLLVREPRLRARTAGLLALLPVLWLGPELWGSGDALRAASRAQDPTLFSAAFADRPALAVTERAGRMVPWPAKAGLVLAVVGGLAAMSGPASDRLRRVLASVVGEPGRARVTLALAGGAAAWLALVALMTELGYAGNSRYLAMPIALGCVVGGVGLGWLTRVIAAALAAHGPRARSAPPAGQRVVDDRSGPGRGRALVAAAVVVLASAAASRAPLDELLGDAREVRAEARLNADLPAALARAGGRERVLACGQAHATALQVPVLAWHLGVPTGQVGIDPKPPAILFRGPPRLQPPDAPAPTVRGLGPVARVGEWTVSARCSSNGAPR